MGGDTSGKSSTTDATMGSSSGQDVWGGQSPALQNLYGQGQQLSQDPSGLNRAATGAYTGAAIRQPGDIYSPALAGYQGAFGGNNPTARAAGSLTDPLVSGLTDIVNTSPDVFGAGGSNPLLDQNVAMALEQASQNFSRNVAPSIKRDAQAMGQYGGSRGDLALGVAAGDANQDALSQAMSAYQQQYRGDRAANLQSQTQADQTRLGAASQIQDLLGANQSGAAQGVDVGMGMQNLGAGQGDILSAAANQQWSPLQQQQQLLGSPTVLGASSSTGISSSDPILNPWGGGGASGGSKGGLPGKGGGSSGGSGGSSGGGGSGIPGMGSDLNPFNW